ncbi:MAG TPA: DoxX family protein [Polyangiaceae bacterium]|nr:DoxX family protein [Polyangiaceae bacterium]
MSLVAKWGPHAARVVLALPFLVTGLNYFLNFLPTPPMPSDRARLFLDGLIASGYIFPVLRTIEVASAIALLTNRFVPLALTLLAPILVNIAGVHFLLLGGYPIPIALLALEIYLVWGHRAAFAPMLRARATPAALAADRGARADRFGFASR